MQKTKLATLKKLIEDDKKPIILNCSTSANIDVYTMGDLQELGWMTKTYTHDMEGEVDGWERHYTGPNSVLVETLGKGELEILKPGETLL